MKHLGTLRRLLLAVSAAGAGSAAQIYTITDVGVLPGYQASYATAINNSGHIVVNSGTASVASNAGNWQAGVWTAGSLAALGFLSPGDPSSYGLGINSAGKVVGSSGYSTNSLFRGFTNDGAMHDIGVLPGSPNPNLYSFAASINDLDQVAGFSEFNGDPNFATGKDHAILWQGGSMQDLGTLPGYSSSHGNSINNAGQVVGFSSGPTGPGLLSYEAFLWSGGSMSALTPVSGDTHSLAWAVNGSGLVVGESGDDLAGRRRAAMWINGIPIGLGTLPGDMCSEAGAVNSAGLAVGDSQGVCTHPSPSQAVLFQGGQVIQLSGQVINLGGWSLFAAADINDSGQIVGWGQLDGVDRGFLLTPSAVSPEPSAWLLVAVGLAVVIVKHRQGSLHI
jgi:probable HAF family extracellular repeat protein